jgi:hypothetical protein
MYDSFCRYQTALLAEFDRLSTEYGFEVVDAGADVRAVFAQLKVKVLRVLERDTREEFVSKRESELRNWPRAERMSISAASD